MPLKKLWLAGTKVTTLDPLRGMRLNFLQISGTAVADIGPLHGMPLGDLKMNGCTNLTHISFKYDRSPKERPRPLPNSGRSSTRQKRRGKAPI